MAEPSPPQPAPGSAGAPPEDIGEDASAGQDAPTGEAGPDISDADRFSVNGKAMPFQLWAEAVMSPIAPREPAAPEAQPEPEAPEVVWLSRRPVE